MQNNIHLIQILFVIAFLALSGLGWVIRKAQEQAEKKRIQTERQRRLDEMLRTGRDPTIEQATAMAQASSADRARLEELARRRQAQMEQLRREHAQRRQEEQRSGKRESELPPIVIMGPSGPVTLPRGPQGRTGGTPARPVPPVQRAGTGRPAAPRQQRPARSPQPKSQQRKADRPVPPRPPAAPTPVPQIERRETAAPTPAQIPGGRVAKRGMIVLPPIRVTEVADAAKGRSRGAEYRRLVAMMEALKPPLAIREQDEPGPVYRAF